MLLIRICEVLKVRWREAVMLVGLHSGALMLLSHMNQVFEKAGKGHVYISVGLSFLLGIASMGLIIVVQMLYLGFLKTAAERLPVPRQPLDLIQTGRIYFWRIFVFQMILFVAVTALGLLLLSLCDHLFVHSPSPDAVPLWMQQVCAPFALLILMKPVFLVPALVLVEEYSLPEAFVRMREYVFFRMKPLPLLAASGFMLIAAAGILTVDLMSQQKWMWIAAGVQGLIDASVVLVVYLGTVCFVEELKSVRREQAK